MYSAVATKLIELNESDEHSVFVCLVLLSWEESIFDNSI